MNEIMEKIARLLAFQTLADDNLDTMDKVWVWVIKNDFTEEFTTKTDSILALVRAEVKEYEPENHTGIDAYQNGRYAGAIEAKQAILAALE